MVSIEVSTNRKHTSFLHFLGSQNILKKWGCTFFNSQACAESKNNKICILGSRLVNALIKVWLGTTFVEIECNLVFFLIQSDSYVYQSANFDPRIKISVFLHFAWAGLLKTVQNYLSRCLASWEIGKTKVCIKLIETSLFTILNVGLSL